MSRRNPYSKHASETICRAIFNTWIPRFGCPSVNTSDQGTQMRSSMYAKFTRMLGTEKIKTTTYHPKSSGIGKRFYGHLKSVIKAHENDTWSEIVPIIHLGIRTAVKEDLLSSCAEIAYGTNLRLPSDMIDASNIPSLLFVTIISSLIFVTECNN
ncbi:retrovirus-related Pol polyprotein from transposon opus [Trichonephila clavipes]|nr:retrovirus-related Pol polyprotein from transposon opus [Trichonephila clavipes]